MKPMPDKVVVTFKSATASAGSGGKWATQVSDLAQQLYAQAHCGSGGFGITPEKTSDQILYHVDYTGGDGDSLTHINDATRVLATLTHAFQYKKGFSIEKATMGQYPADRLGTIKPSQEVQHYIVTVG